MASIGYVSKTNDGYSGKLALIKIQTDIRFVANATTRSPDSPDFRIMAGPAEIGAAWSKTSREGKDYTSGILAHPELGPAKIAFTLGRAAEQDDADAFALIWNPYE